jgi:hypothetical protein
VAHRCGERSIEKGKTLLDGPRQAEEDFMRPSFGRVWKEIGVVKWTWDTRSILMLPLQWPSLILVRNAKGHPLQSGPGLTMTRIDKSGVSAALDQYLAQFVTGLRLRNLAGELWSALIPELQVGGVLLSVSSKAAGMSWLKAGVVKQQVEVTRPLVSDVSFKFLHHLDENGNMLPATHKDPAFVDDWIADVNWILGAQANVWFEKANAVPVQVNEVLGQPVGDAVLRNYLVKEKDGLADVTVFLVGKWKGKTGGDPAGSFFPDLNVITVDDKPAIPIVAGNDPFTVVLAHELVHYVLHYRGYGSFHLHDQHALLNDQVESSVVVPDLQWKLTHNK